MIRVYIFYLLCASVSFYEAGYWHVGLHMPCWDKEKSSERDVSAFRQQGWGDRQKGKTRESDTKRLLTFSVWDPWLGWQSSTSPEWECEGVYVCVLTERRLQDMNKNTGQLPFSRLVHTGFGLTRQLLYKKWVQSLRWVSPFRQKEKLIMGEKLSGESVSN